LQNARIIQRILEVAQVGAPWSPVRYVLTIVECQIPVTIIGALLLGLRWVLRG